MIRAPGDTEMIRRVIRKWYAGWYGNDTPGDTGMIRRVISTGIRGALGPVYDNAVQARIQWEYRREGIRAGVRGTRGLEPPREVTRLLGIIGSRPFRIAVPLQVLPRKSQIQNFFRYPFLSHLIFLSHQFIHIGSYSQQGTYYIHNIETSVSPTGSNTPSIFLVVGIVVIDILWGNIKKVREVARFFF